MLRKALHKTYNQKYIFEASLLILMVVAGLVVFFQYELIESFVNREDAAELKFHDLKISFTIKSHWPQVGGTSHQLYVYSAYFDNREENNFIRIIGLSQSHFNADIQCQIYFSGETETAFVAAKLEPLVKDGKGKLVAAFVTCTLPEGSDIPRAVALATGPDLITSNMLLVHQALPRTENTESMAVCVELLDNNYSQETRLLEFIEFNKLLGVDHLYFYKQAVSKDIDCLLSDYAKQGKITVIDWNVPSEETNPITGARDWQEIGKLAAFNDCLYKTMSYDYTSFLAIDEFIIPKTAKSLKDLIRTKENASLNNQAAVYEFKVANFYLEWPDEWAERKTGFYLMTVHRMYRTIAPSNISTTFIFKPKAVLQVKANYDLKIITGYQSTTVDETEGTCHRYRLSPPDQPPPPLSQAVRDTSADRFNLLVLRGVLKQYHKSKPHCALSDEENVQIQLAGPDRQPILVFSK